MVADNAILLNCAVSSENISEIIKIKTENGFYLKVNVGIFRRNKSRPERQSHRRHLFISVVRKRKFNSGIHGVLTGQLDQIGVEKCKQPFPILWDEQKKFFGIE